MSVLAAVLTHPVLAQAGSGSSGFSGGGGGGGGGGFSGGGSSGSGSGSLGFGGVLVIVLVVLVIGGGAAWGAWKAKQRREARDRRDAEVRTGAAQAVEDDAAFDADALVVHAKQLVREVQRAWDRRDRTALRTFIGGDLLTEWIRRLDDFDEKKWHNRVQVKGDPEVRLITIENRRDDADDRVVVHLEVPMDSWVNTPQGKKYPDGKDGPRITLSEYWTLAKHDGTWQLISIEGEEEGGHHLTSKMILEPSDDPDLAAATRTELATGDAAAGSVAGLVATGFADDARAAALDLSLVDDRWSPDVLEIAVDRAIAAWATAVDGPDEDLERLAEPAAVQRLLHGSDTSGKTRTVVRGPRLEQATITRVTDEGERGTMSVDLRYRARWYREDRDTAAVLEGSKDDERVRTDAWTFALTDDAEDPWRLVAVG
ncbi:TIM44-like domain-containing protein [Patulibacter minatonensis]|uniref:TIM44-like domain-containing protein n=1 Tax=Patulibacter minatonensis TaxID=298163 RepID=UPI000565D748|nr:TIM44-like domain-containing protein [Patulibacter minatonensis]